MAGGVRVVASCALLLLVLLRVATADTSYTDNDDLTEFLVNTSKTYASITHLYSIGKSVQGRELWVLAISESVNEHVKLRPDSKYVGNIHGNEPVSRELLIRLITHLTSNYGVDDTITALLRSSRVHILVSMNPDGFYRALHNDGEGNCTGLDGRQNALGFDLNRNFPDAFVNNPAEIQIETRAVMDWVKKKQFVLSSNLHGGMLIVNYPYDNFPGAGLVPQYAKYAKSPDDDVYKMLANTYARAHPTLYNGSTCPNLHPQVKPLFATGIVNGAEWYPITGGMQDYNYIYAGCMAMTLEISCCKFPTADTLEGHWEDNRDALVALLQKVNMGIKGTVKNLLGTPIPNASVSVVGREWYVYTTNYGEFWRLLLPGSYDLQVEAADFQTSLRQVTVSEGQPTVVDIRLLHSSSRAPSPHSHRLQHAAIALILIALRWIV